MSDKEAVGRHGVVDRGEPAKAAGGRRSSVSAERGPATPGGRVDRRRAQTRKRLLEVAERLVRERGIDSVTIDDITETADIARRSFYNHFDSKHDLLVPLARSVTKSLNRRIDLLFSADQDPAEVVAIGLRHTIRGVIADPLCRWFVLRSGLPHDRLREGIGESAARDLARGVAAGRFDIGNQAALEHLLAGALVGVLSALMNDALGEADVDDSVEYFLRVLGLPAGEAREIAHRPLPPLPADQP